MRKIEEFIKRVENTKIDPELILFIYSLVQNILSLGVVERIGLLYGLMRGGIDDLSEVARRLGVSVNVALRWVKNYVSRGIVSKNGKYRVSRITDAVRLSVSYLLKSSSSIEGVFGKINKVLDKG